MAGQVKGITIEIAGDTSQFDRSIRDADKSMSKLDKELRNVNNALKFNPTSVDLWRQKQTLLTQKISETQTKLDMLKAKQRDMDSKGVDKNSEEYRKLQREIITTESKLKTFKGQLKSIGNAKLTALGAQFKQIGAKMTAVGKSLSMYVTAPLAGVGAASLKAGADFDTAMSQVAATSGKTVAEIQDLRDFAKQMGSTTAFSATQAAEGLNYMALAGYDAEKSIKMLPTVLNLAAAGAMELGAASDMVTDAQTALGLSIEDTTMLVDQMAQTSAKSNTSVSQMGEAILKIGGTAKNLTGGTRELAQVLGLLADNGIKGSEAGTHLRNIMLALNPTTDKAADAWDALGISAYDADGNLKPLEKTFGELSNAMKDMSSEERTKFLSAMFNKTDLSSVNALIDTSAERWKELGFAIDDAGGAAQKMADTQLDNMQGSLTLLKSALEGAGIAISDALSPYVRMLADFISDLISKFNALDPSVQKTIAIVGALVAALGPLLVIGGMIASAIGALLPVIGGISAPVLAIGAAIGALVVVLTTAYAKSEAFRSAVNDVAKAIGGMFLSAIKSLAAQAKLLFTEIQSLGNELGINLGGILKWIVPIIKAVAKVLIDALKRHIELIIVTVRLLVAAIRAIVGPIKSAFSSISTAAAGAYNKIKNVFSGVKNALVRPFETAKNVIKGIVDSIKGFFNFSVKAPHVPLPHFSIKPSGWKLSDLLKGVKPSLSIDWYAKGGIFNSPTIAGIGEAGPEAVVPLDKFWDKLSELQGGMVVNVYGSDNMSVNELADKVAQKIIQTQKRRRMAWQ